MTAIAPDAMVRIAELTIDPDQVEPYLRALEDEITASLRLEPGVLMLSAVRIRDKPNQIRILEIYASRTAYEDHLQSPHFLTYKTLTATMVQQLVLIDADPVAIGVKPDGLNRI